jgi:hypothetical protein
VREVLEAFELHGVVSLKRIGPLTMNDKWPSFDLSAEKLKPEIAVPREEARLCDVCRKLLQPGDMVAVVPELHNGSWTSVEIHQACALPSKRVRRAKEPMSRPTRLRIGSKAKNTGPTAGAAARTRCDRDHVAHIAEQTECKKSRLTVEEVFPRAGVLNPLTRKVTKSGDDERRGTHRVYREAAQFVTALRLECGAWHRLSIEPDGPRCISQILHDSDRSERVDRMIIAISAARAAHARFDAADIAGNDDLSACDEDEIRRLARRLRGVALDELRARAIQLVAEHWSDIALIAQELVCSGSLDESEAQLMIDAAHGDPTSEYWLFMLRHPEVVRGGDA